MTDERSYAAGTRAGWKGDKPAGREAAFAVSQDLPRRHAQVLAAFEPYGASGATCDDIAPGLELPIHVVRPRASELERKGKLFPIGKRPGAMGYACTIYSTVRPFELTAEVA